MKSEIDGKENKNNLNDEYVTRVFSFPWKINRASEHLTIQNQRHHSHSVYDIRNTPVDCSCSHDLVNVAIMPPAICELPEKANDTDIQLAIPNVHCNGHLCKKQCYPAMPCPAMLPNQTVALGKDNQCCLQSWRSSCNSAVASAEGEPLVARTHRCNQKVFSVSVLLPDSCE